MKTLKLLTSALVFAMLCSFTPASIKFEYVFKPGDQYEWTQTTKQIIKQNIMGTDQVIENNIVGVIVLKVSTVTAGGATVEAQYKSLSMRMKMPGSTAEQVMDSQGDTAKAENKIMKALVEKPFTLTISKLGVIEKIDGEENLWSDFSSLKLSEQQIQSMKASLEQNLNEASLKSSFEMIFINYPDKKIKTGDSWKTKTVAGSNFPLVTENNWTFTNLAGDVATVSGAGIISTSDKEKIVSLPSNMKSKFDLGGTQKTTSTINTKTGWSSEIIIASEIKGTMKLLAGGMIPQDMDIPMQIITDTNCKLIKK